MPINAPFGPADIQAPVYGATLAVTLTNKMTILKPGTLTGAMTINLTIDSSFKGGEELLVELVADGTNRVVTFGTGFLMVALTVTASKTFAIQFTFDGTQFVAGYLPVTMN